MNANATGHDAAAQDPEDPEDLFELPEFYQGIAAPDRCPAEPSDQAFREYRRLLGFGDADLEPSPDLLRLLDLVREKHPAAEDFAQRSRQSEPGVLVCPLTTFLFPERPDWFWADMVAAGDDVPASLALLPSATTADQASALAERFRKLPEWEWNGDPAVEAAFLTVAGAGALSFLTAWCDTGHRCPVRPEGEPCPIHARCLDLIARIPSEAAIKDLVRRDERDGAHEYLNAAMRRFPRRALRVLAEAEVGTAADDKPIPTLSLDGAPDYLRLAARRSPRRALRVLAEGRHSEATGRLLATMVLADPAFARAEGAKLEPRARDLIEALLRDAAPVAAPADLPEFLAAPPWRDKKRKRGKPVVVEGLTPPAAVEVAWLPGEREEWLTGHGAGWTPEQGWEALLPTILDDTVDVFVSTYFAAYAPEELVRPRLAAWLPPFRHVTDRARTFVAKYETLALPTVLSLSTRSAVRAELLQPFASAEIAAIMADGLARLRSMRAHAATWLLRHPEAAVRGLVPTALGKPGKLRQNTVAALRFLEADGVDVVGIAAQTYGEDVGTATKEVLADLGFETYPRTVPQAPPWARAALLPEIRLKDRQTTLPPGAAQAVVEMLMFSKPDTLYPGLEAVKELCEGSSLAEFVGSLYDAWEKSGAPEDERWVFGALGTFGDDTTVVRLEKLIRDWYGKSKSDYVYDGFGALAAIGGDRALVALYSFSRRSWNARTKRKAQATFEDVAQSMDLSADRLADRLVPTPGLSAEGTLHLDYGRRGFDVSFDELLRPVVTDETGAVLRALPKPGKRDDPELAPASYRRFSTLKTQARIGAQEQSIRLERAMLERRRWLPQEFGAYLVRHLVLGRLVRRLVWGAYAADGGLVGAFRVAEDLSFADVDDERYEIPEGVLIGVVHPVDLGPALGRWSEVFSDYEILQPFDQLGRPPLALTPEEQAGKQLMRAYIFPDADSGSRSVGVRYGPTKFEALTARGWRRGPIGADRLWSRLLRPVGDGRCVVMELEPGLEAGAAVLSEYQAITAVWLSETGDEPDFDRHALPLSALDAGTVSVVLRDLEERV